jgi:hypothetical protein
MIRAVDEFSESKKQLALSVKLESQLATVREILVRQ